MTLFTTASVARRTATYLWLLMLGSCGPCLGASLSLATYDMLAERNVAVRMRDDVVLRADVYQAARNNQRLLILIGTHISGRKIGDVDFGPEALKAPRLFHLVPCWYDYPLKGVLNRIDREKPVKFFVMRKNELEETNSWPPAQAVGTEYYLCSNGSANSLNGDGTLSTEPPLSEPADHFVYDPADPVPTRGVNLCWDAPHFPPGPFDQCPNEARSDVLVYSTPQLKSDVEVTGPLSIDLYASSSAVDTDFTGKLVDVWPGGFLRARDRKSPEKPEFITPGDVYRIHIDLWAIGNVFKAGHRIRLEISSSNFPLFDRNLNTGWDPEFGRRMVKASNAVYHDRDRLSAVILSVAPARPSSNRP